MRLLVLGGTKFVGRAVVEEALARGHDVTLFNRGRTNPELFPDAEHLVGNRDGDLSALEGRTWDAVVDPSGYVPRVVRASAELLRDAVGHYVFVSSVSAYATPYGPRFTEEAPLAELDDPPSEDVRANYGGLKVACERVVEDAFAGRCTLVRAGLVVGPHDPTDRFTYWVTRAARGAEVLAPAPADRHVQFIDVRDLAEWMLRCAEEPIPGAFTVTGPVPPVTMADLLDACVRAGGTDARPVWVDEEFLLEHEVGPWMELPLWLPESDAEHGHMLDGDVSKAVAAGLRFRPLDETVRDTLAWARSRDGAGEGTVAMGGTEGVGLEPERERELLMAWRGARSA